MEGLTPLFATPTLTTHDYDKPTTTPDAHDAPAGDDGDGAAPMVSGALPPEVGGITDKITETSSDAPAADAKSLDADKTEPPAMMITAERARRLRFALDARELTVPSPVFSSVSLIVDHLSRLSLTADRDQDADDLGDMLDLSYSQALTLVEYLHTGKPRPGILVTELLTVKQNLFHKSPVGKATLSASPTPPSPLGSDAGVALVQALTDSVKGLHSSSRPGINHYQAKDQLSGHPPSFWVDMDKKQYGARFVPCPDYMVAVNTAPLDPRGLAARPLITVGRVQGLLEKVFGKPETWPDVRSPLLAKLGIVFVHFAGSALLNGTDLPSSLQIGELEVGSLLDDACASISSLSADIAVHRQDGRPNAVDILRAIDRRCAVPLVAIDATWFSLKVESGESLLALWDRVRAAGARCNRSYTAIVERVQQILYAEALTNSNTVARMAYDFLGEVADKYTDAAALEMMLRTRLLSKEILIPESRKERPPRPRSAAGMDEPAVLATSPTSTGYDITVGLKAYREVHGKEFNDGQLPGMGAQQTCAFCIHFGAKPGDFVDFDPSNPRPAGKINRHNPWRCPKYPRFCDELIAAKPSLLKCELCRRIENIAEVREAAIKESA